MSSSPREIAGRSLAGPEAFQREVVEACRPVVIRGLASDWPVVAAAARAPAAFRDYLRQFDSGEQTEAFFGEPQIAGKYYYRDDLQGFNFERRRMRFDDALDAM